MRGDVKIYAPRSYLTVKSDSEVTPDMPTEAKTGQDCGHYRRRRGDQFWDIYGHAVKPRLGYQSAI